MKKVSKFLKNYGFYLAICVICVGALIAIFTLPNKEGNVTDNGNPYARNETADGSNLEKNKEKEITIVDEDDLDETDKNTVKANDTQKLQSAEKTESPEVKPEGKQTAAPKETPESKTEGKKVASKDANVPEPKTFESTTASVVEEPFFAEGDTFVWPADGKVVVPYTDESTSHWYSQSLNQTMRTFGICVAGNEGDKVKAVAKGTVTKIVEDSSAYLGAGMPYVGKVMVVDHGNGYVSLYGFQGGKPNEALVGQVVNAGDTLGTIGAAKGAFINEGTNIYLQVKHDDQVVNPLTFMPKENVAKEDSVDVGFAK